MLYVIHLQCIMEDFSTVKYKHSNTMYVPCAVYSHFIFQPSPINTVPVMFTIHCYTCFATLRIQSNELNQSYMCPLPETAVTCDSHDTDNVWLISPWYKLCDTHDTGAHWYKHDTATSDTHDTDGVWPLLPDTIMTLPNVTHDTDIVRPPSTWYNHDTATCDTHDIVWPLLPDTIMTLPNVTHGTDIVRPPSTW